jgi:DNA-binding transcriptional MerR regulator
MNRENLINSRQTYSVSATAERLGVAPATLRTWARRHGMGPSQHSSGSHRRYTDTDLAKLMTLRTYLLRGATAAEAVHAAQQAAEDGVTLEAAEGLLQEVLREKGMVTPKIRPVELVEGGVSSSTTSLARARRERGSGRNSVLRIAPSAPHAVEYNDYKARCTELVSAALRDDEERCTELLTVASEESLIDWWKLLVRPALDRISTHTVLSSPGKAPRLLVGFLAQRALADHVGEVRPDLATADRPHPSRLKNITLVFSSALDELSLPAHVLVAALLQNKCNAHVILGPGNTQRVSELIKIVRPSVVAFVSDHATPSLEILHSLTQEFPELPIYVGVREGVDTRAVRHLGQVSAINSFRALYHEVYAAVRAAAPGAEYWSDDDSTFRL